MEAFWDSGYLHNSVIQQMQGTQTRCYGKNSAERNRSWLADFAALLCQSCVILDQLWVSCSSQ